MIRYAKACMLELVLSVILYTSIVAFVNDCNKEHYYYRYYYCKGLENDHSVVIE